MFQKFLNWILPIHKQGLLIMQVLKFGRINHMTVGVIFGRWVVFYMRWLLKGLLLQLQISNHFTKKFVLENFRESLVNILMIYGQPFAHC
jgi:hypothetical protein